MVLTKVGTGVVGQADCSIGSATIGPVMVGNDDYEVVIDSQGPTVGTATLKVSTGGS